VLLEIFPGLVALRPLQRPFIFWTAMGQPVAGSFLLDSPPFGLFACGAKIDDVAHVKLGGNQMLLHKATLARFCLEQLRRTLALEHGNSESSTSLRLPRGVWLYP
jgi:hypothetical protein